MCFLLLFRLELFEPCSTHGKWQESQSVNKNRHCLLRSWFGTDSLSFHHVALAQTSHMAEWEISKARKFHFGRWFCKVTWSKSWLYNLNPGRLWRTTNNHFPYLPGVWSLPLVLSCCEAWRKWFLSPSPVVIEGPRSAASASSWNLLDLHTLMPDPDLLNQKPSLSGSKPPKHTEH